MRLSIACRSIGLSGYGKDDLSERFVSDMAKGKDMAQRISVIIPVYNPGAHLIRCLDSLLDQTYQELEIILVDDGSSDGSPEICDRYVARDARMLCIHQENRGVSSARNRGLEICSGEYVHFLDSDDFLETDCYERVIRCFEEQACKVVCFEHFVDYPRTSIRHAQPKGRYCLCDGREAVDRLFDGFQFACTKVVSAELIRELRFREDIFRGEDTLFAAEVLARADSVYYTDQALYHYVQSEESATRGSFRESQLTILKLYEAYDRLFADNSFRARHFMPYMHDNLIMIYYDMASDEQNHAVGKKAVIKALRQHYFWAVRDGHSLKQLSKYTLATCFPRFFCLLHKKLHHL